MLNTETQRLEFFINSIGETITSVAERIGASRATLSSVISGRRNLTDRMIARIKLNYPSLNLDWIKTGNGPMLLPEQDRNSSFSINETQGDQSPIVNGNSNEVNSKWRNGKAENRNFETLKKEIEALQKTVSGLESQLSTKDAQIAEKDNQIKQLLELLSKK